MALLAAVPQEVLQRDFFNYMNFGFCPPISAVLAPARDNSSRGSMLKVQGVSFGTRSFAPLKRLDSKSRTSSLKKRGTICMSNGESRSTNPAPALEDSKERIKVEPPYLDPPLTNVFKDDKPYQATIQSVKTIAGTQGREDEVCHVTIKNIDPWRLSCWEGQRYRVILPNQHYPEEDSSFMLASTRYGDSFDGKTASLCVRRRGGDVIKYLCDAKPETEVCLAGPSTKGLLAAPDNPNATHIMIASGTGIAPFRGFIRRMFVVDVPKFKFKGKAWLIFGAPESPSGYYDDELNNYKHLYESHFTYDKASDDTGGLSATLKEHVADIFSKLEKGAYIYLCGPNDLLGVTNTVFYNEAVKQGKDWYAVLRQLKASKQWRDMTYDTTSVTDE